MKQLPLHTQHEALGAKIGEFAGYAMPLYYTKPIEEHQQVRAGAGVFDISHMGQFVFSGARTAECLHYALPGDVNGMADGQALYGPLCREDGGVLDDLIVYRHDASRYRAIVNGATREKDRAWLGGIALEFGVTLEDVSEQFCLLAVQGPAALSKLAPYISGPLEAMAYYTFMETTAFGEAVFLARTGYTGEPGCEIAVAREQAGTVWERLVGELGIPPIGLAARDTLRLEACMPLYGHELREEWHVLECGLGWAVKLERQDEFIGKKALRAIQGVGFPYRQVGLEITGRGIPREGCAVMHEGREMGRVTSGTHAPTVNKGVALARVRVPAYKTGTAVQVEVRGKPVDALVVKKPFYRNPALRGGPTSPAGVKLPRLFK